MSHNVERMFFTGKKPWWYGNRAQEGAVGINLGADAVTSEKAMIGADLGFNVLKRNAGFLDPNIMGDFQGTPGWKAVPDECFLVRDTDGKVLGRCNSGYQTFQPAEAFEFLDGLVADGEMIYHTAGSLEGGKRIWILAQTPQHWTVKRRSGKTNHHFGFLLVTIGFSGDIGISILPTDVRAECANTVGWADSKAEGANLIFRIAHRGNIAEKLQLAADAIRVMTDQTPARKMALQAMAQHAMTTDEFIDFATSIFLGLDGDEAEIEEGRAKFYEDATPRSKTIMENKVAKVTHLFQAGQGNEGDSIYDALQGFEEYFDHFDIGKVRDDIEKGKRAAKAVQSSWIGAGAERKSLVYKRLNQIVKR